MLFNSHIFIFLFLPITLAGFFLIGKTWNHRYATIWLTIASLFFYGWWNPVYLILIVFSIIFNFYAGSRLARATQGEKIKRPKALLVFSIGVNIALIAYFKYANFFVDNLNSVLGTEFFISAIVLPLAISFFTFQQVAFLIDSYRAETREYDFQSYALFVTFFPQLIAGPIVHHKDMMPQFAKEPERGLGYANLSIGLTIFSLGLFKKVVLADGIALFATPVFSAAGAGDTLSFFTAWTGALSYTFQLYFDFSGYSDMAVGIGTAFGIRLPLNFSSPYKATNIIDFWRRWHITLSTFFRDYVYFPLGGSRETTARTLFNLIITMLLGGLWHGAGWTFVFWGFLHGVYLAINHGWRMARRSLLGHDLEKSTLAGRVTGTIITFLAVVVSWVFFRADSFTSALGILRGMAGLNGVEFYIKYLKKWPVLAPKLSELGVKFSETRLF
ncbi:MAG: MBOAT family protein, partial [Thermodesulfobacteriota bacterium]